MQRQSNSITIISKLDLYIVGVVLLLHVVSLYNYTSRARARSVHAGARSKGVTYSVCRNGFIITEINLDFVVREYCPQDILICHSISHSNYK